MEAMRTNRLFLSLAVGLFLVQPRTLLAEAPPRPDAASDVILTGWLHVEDYFMDDMVVRIEVDGTTRTAPVSANGRFEISLPADREVVLRFEKPGHLAKEVVVNTSHARQGEPGKRKRHVRFAVIMELERHMAGFGYHSPVGTIGFDQDGGCLAVEHHREKVPPSRHQPMEF